MLVEAKDRIAQRLRPELERLDTVSGDEAETVIRAFTVLDSSAPNSGHIQYRLAHVDPAIEQRSDIAEAIQRAVHAAGYYLAGEE